ncbi:MAG: Asp-tRNA(Asn)/Glu-tRNA(Gln) amidotransferase subunit GatB [Mycoplasmataceae bacterium]|nr:Asp-tRNA(Asn)/Glu-tRNA(Gln) amidotransferase subunit GatB [Mycoplasmataceae bacterium]
MSNFEVVIGIEIHIELNTKTKMFSSAPNTFGDEENTNVSATDIAYPGTMPVVNKQAIVKAIKLAKALNMKIDDLVRFDRKNYFYPDLPKGFQITQQNFPIGSSGKLSVNGRSLTIERIHLEEDTAKAFHKGESTLLNYNRAGVPLIEIVSDPVIKSAEEAANYIETIRDIAIALDISDAKMEEGSMRADINISIKKPSDKVLGTKVEIKNLNSISNVRKAIFHEIEVQTKEVTEGREIIQSTKRFDESIQKTVVMRVKKDALDYRYIPEPNIPPIKLSKKFIDDIKIEELPGAIKERYIKLSVEEKYAQLLSVDPALNKYFDLIEFTDKSKVAKLIFSDVMALANTNKIKVEQLNIEPSQIKELLNKIKSGEISGKQSKIIIPLLVDGKNTVSKIIKEKGMKQISDEKILTEMVLTIIKDNKDFIKQNETRPERVIKYILGQVMKVSKGQANPALVSKIVQREWVKGV